ncbi:MAG: hypothetical protein HFF90_02240 [Oscillibacter sp.]|nr:hypothetical protein [Oscillibacter sp.]
MYTVLSIILIGVGLLMLVSPETFYNLTEGWKHSGGSGPSRSYVFSTRFGGVMMLAVGSLGIVGWIMGWL